MTTIDPEAVRAQCGDGLIFEPVSHRYFRGDVEHIPVTTVVEGSLPENPMKHLWTERHRRLGSVIHQVTALHDEGRLVVDSIAPAVLGRYQAWLKFREQHPFIPIACELPCWSVDGTAGTTDRLCWYDDRLAVLDVKSWLDKTYTALQTAGYASMITERTGLVPVVRIGVGLHDDGTFDFARFDDYVEDSRAWKNAVALFAWKLRRGAVRLRRES